MEVLQQTPEQIAQSGTFTPANDQARAQAPTCLAPLRCILTPRFASAQAYYAAVAQFTPPPPAAQAQFPSPPPLSLLSPGFAGGGCEAVTLSFGQAALCTVAADPGGRGATRIFTVVPGATLGASAVWPVGVLSPATCGANTDLQLTLVQADDNTQVAPGVISRDVATTNGCQTNKLTLYNGGSEDMNLMLRMVCAANAGCSAVVATQQGARRRLAWRCGWCSLTRRICGSDSDFAAATAAAAAAPALAAASTIGALHRDAAGVRL